MHSYRDSETDGRHGNVNDVVDMPGEVSIFCRVKKNSLDVPALHFFLFTHVFPIFQYQLNSSAAYVQVFTQCSNFKTSIFIIWGLNKSDVIV